MIKSDFKEFTKMWMSAHAASSSNSAQSNDVIKYIFELLEKYPLEHVRQAIKKHSSITKFAPTPADIIELLETKNKHITADEAWAICPKSEYETVVWTKEIAEAFSCCRDIHDEVAARMSFKSAYERIVNLSNLQNRRPEWFVSVGFDKTAVEAPVRRAIELGRLPHQKAKKYLSAPTDGGVIGKLLTGKTVNEYDGNIEQIKRLKQIIKNAGHNHD